MPATTRASTGATSAGIDDLLEQAVELHAADADGRDRRADDAADQRVRARGRQAEVPGREVPCDRADQAGEHDLRRDRRRR